MILFSPEPEEAQTKKAVTLKGMPQDITKRCDSRLHQFMEQIRAQRKICVLNHAVGLCETGKSAEGKQNQNQIRIKVTAPVNPAGDFQDAVIKPQNQGRQIFKGYKDNI